MYVLLFTCWGHSHEAMYLECCVHEAKEVASSAMSTATWVAARLEQVVQFQQERAFDVALVEFKRSKEVVPYTGIQEAAFQDV